MSMEKYWNWGGWTLRAYLWKGVPYVAVYRGRVRMGVLKADLPMVEELARLTGAKLVNLGEVRETPTITVHAVTTYEPTEIKGNGWGDYDGPSTLAEIQAADAEREEGEF